MWCGQARPRATRTGYPWPYQLEAIEVTDLAAAIRTSCRTTCLATAPAWAGFTIFRGQCIACHSDQRRGRQGRSRPERPAEHRRVSARSSSSSATSGTRRRSATATCRRRANLTAPISTPSIAYFDGHEGRRSTTRGRPDERLDCTARCSPSTPVASSTPHGRFRRASLPRPDHRTAGAGGRVRRRSPAASRCSLASTRRASPARCTARATATAPSSSTPRSPPSPAPGAASSSTSCRRDAAPASPPRRATACWCRPAATASPPSRPTSASAWGTTIVATTRWRRRCRLLGIDRAAAAAHQQPRQAGRAARGRRPHRRDRRALEVDASPFSAHYLTAKSAVGTSAGGRRRRRSPRCPRRSRFDSRGPCAARPTSSSWRRTCCRCARRRRHGSASTSISTRRRAGSAWC